MPDHHTPSFNLWTQPWIDLECLDGSWDRQGIFQTLIQSHQISNLYSPSPLEVVGIYRLLVAILQFCFQPKESRDLRDLLNQGCFDPAVIEQFGRSFAQRFDLFAAETPFFQSADLPQVPEKGSSPKTVAYLAMDFPSGTGVIHYHHRLDEEHIFCPKCVARGLVVIPAFATTGGAGIKPSINGVPPIYVLPMGNTLFESLVCSLLTVPFQPPMAAPDLDLPWWLHPPIVTKSAEVFNVGYLHSLTFPARRVRLHPELLNQPCTRCGEASSWGVRSMVFEMGESRPKEVELWQDPFAAYILKEDKPPSPLRPLSGKAVWREFAALFFKSVPSEGGSRAIRPRMIEQLEEIQIPHISFRCVGLLTDMKAKIFEWADASFNLSLSLLSNPLAGLEVKRALDFAQECEKTLNECVKIFLNKNSKKSQRHASLRIDLQNNYWAELAMPFRKLILEMTHACIDGNYSEQRASLSYKWKEQVVRIGLAVVESALNQIGEDGRSLRLIHQCMVDCRRKLYGKLKQEKGTQ